MADPSKRTAKDDSDSEPKAQDPRPTRAAASQKTPRSKQTVRTEKASDAGTPGVSHILILTVLDFNKSSSHPVQKSTFDNLNRT